MSWNKNIKEILDNTPMFVQLENVIEPKFINSLKEVEGLKILGFYVINVPKPMKNTIELVFITYLERGPCVDASKESYDVVKQNGETYYLKNSHDDIFNFDCSDDLKYNLQIDSVYPFKPYGALCLPGREKEAVEALITEYNR